MLNAIWPNASWIKALVPKHQKWAICLSILFLNAYSCFAQKDTFTYQQAQTDSVLVQDILNALSTGGVQLSYDPQIIPASKILLTTGQWNTLALLKKIEAETNLRYQKIGRNYILLLKEGVMHIISGTVIDKHSSEHVIGATVRIKGTDHGVITNAYGYFSLEVPHGKNGLEIGHLGYKATTLDLDVTANQQLNISLIEKTIDLEELTIEGSTQQDFANPQFGTLTLTTDQFNNSPSLFGESDVLRQLQQASGVQMTSESSAGFSVRGSRPNQNLMLLDEAIIYNPTHVVGFFSIFNTDALNNVSFYKGNVPAKYGGRLASVTNIQMKEGNKQQLTGTGSITPMTANLTLEAPIKKNKSSFMLAGRRTYFDLLLNNALDNSGLSFYDINIKVNYQLGKKDHLFVSTYLGKDRFQLSEDTFNFKWGNQTFTTRWNHIFNQKLFLNTSFIYSDYRYDLIFSNSNSQYSWFNRLKNSTFKADFDYFLDNHTILNFGINSSYHTIKPAFLSFMSFGDPQENSSRDLNNTQGIESGVYIEVEKEIRPKLTVIAGLRLSSFHNIGPTTQFVFNEAYQLIDSIPRKKGEVFNAFYNLEPRFTSSYQFSPSSFIKLSYNRSVQYVSQASNSLIGSPLDTWFLASPTVEPLQASQISLGYFKKLGKKSWALGIETYYKRVKNEIDFKDNATLLLNEKLEGELRRGKATAYGLEIGLDKTEGTLTGAMHLTLNRSLIRSAELNNGLTYPSPYERPISLSITGKYELDPYKVFQINWVYFSGLPFSSPTGKFTYGNVVIPTYTNRNADRLPSYHRLDLGLRIQNHKKENAKIRGSWNFSIYNVYYRRNANFLTFRSVEGTNRVEAIKYTIFGWIPSISYRFEF